MVDEKSVVSVCVSVCVFRGGQCLEEGKCLDRGKGSVVTVQYKAGARVQLRMCES